MSRIVGLIVEQKPKFVCPVCGKTYASQENLDKHIAAKHPEGEDA
jgi:transposase-like protein